MENSKLNSRAQDVANNSGLIEEVINDLISEIEQLENDVQYWKNQHEEEELKVEWRNKEIDSFKNDIAKLQEQLDEQADEINDLRIHIKNP